MRTNQLKARPFKGPSRQLTPMPENVCFRSEALIIYERINNICGNTDDGQLTGDLRFSFSSPAISTALAKWSVISGDNALLGRWRGSIGQTFDDCRHRLINDN